MEQLFKCVCLDNREYLTPFNQTMEGRFTHDDSILQALTLLKCGNQWHGSKIVWAGSQEKVKEGEKTFYEIATNKYTSLSPTQDKEITDYISDRYVNTQIFASESCEIRYLVNFYLNEYVDLVEFQKEHEDLPHALPFLTSTPIKGTPNKYKDYLGRWRLCRLGAYEELPANLKLKKLTF